MDRDTNSRTSAETSLLAYARTAGLMFVVVMVLALFNVHVVDTRIVVPGNVSATVANLAESAVLYRLAIASNVLMYVGVVVLATALYVVLRTVDANLALLALLCRLAEAVTGAGVTVMSGLVPLVILDGEARFSPEQLEALIGLFLGINGVGLDVVLVFIGVGGTLFGYLFFVSRYVPRIWAVLAMLTYSVMLILSLTSIVMPHLPESVKLVFYLPGGLFEILFGLWLLVKGVDIHQAPAAGA